ncbi:MAG: enoyl-ACP reductase FabI [Actinomycetota bacterium]|nr:enoyl-ACP reductase FabI [Actinomycetota bacterium]
MLLEGKRVLVTGVLSESSIAFSVARLAQEQGAEVVLTSFGRAMSLTKRAARRLPVEADVLELDITDPANLAALADELRGRWGRVDGVLHAVAFAPPSCLGGNFLTAEWDDVALTLNVSAYSLKALATALLPLMEFGGGSLVGLDFDASQAWPAYDWMGVAKAALESTARYLARDLGRHHVRVNLVSAGPLRTIAAKGIAGFDKMESAWAGRAPLGWDTGDARPVAQACVALLSDWFPATTGEILHVDGGFHAVAAAVDK